MNESFCAERDLPQAQQRELDLQIKGGEDNSYIKGCTEIQLSVNDSLHFAVNSTVQYHATDVLAVSLCRFFSSRPGCFGQRCDWTVACLKQTEHPEAVRPRGCTSEIRKREYGRPTV